MGLVKKYKSYLTLGLGLSDTLRACHVISLSQIAWQAQRAFNLCRKLGLLKENVHDDIQKWIVKYVVIFVETWLKWAIIRLHHHSTKGEYLFCSFVSLFAVLFILREARLCDN